MPEADLGGGVSENRCGSRINSAQREAAQNHKVKIVPENANCDA